MRLSLIQSYLPVADETDGIQDTTIEDDDSFPQEEQWEEDAPISLLSDPLDQEPIYLANSRQRGRKRKDFGSKNDDITGFPSAYLRCYKCNIGFGKRCRYLEHMKKHTAPLKCSYCHFKTRSGRTLQMHELKHQKQNPEHECDECGGKFPTPLSLRSHYIKHSIWKCARCPLKCKSLGERSLHMQEVHGQKKSGTYGFVDEYYDEEEEYQSNEQNTCGICSKQCRSRALLKIHVAQHLQINPSQLSDQLHVDVKDEEEIDLVDSNNVQKSTKKRSSYFDDSEFIPPKKLKSIPEPVTYELITEDVDLRTFIKDSSENAVFTCGRCYSNFTTSFRLLTHVINKHTFLDNDARNHRIKMANSNMPRVPDMKCENNVYFSVPPRPIHLCKICGDRFSKGDNLKKHMRTHEVGRRKCSMCSFKSRTCSRVIQHQKVKHRGMLVCPRLCLALFKDKDSLDHHKEIVHGIPRKLHLMDDKKTEIMDAPEVMAAPERECEYCGLKFYRLCDLEKHVRKHQMTRRKCPECHFRARTTKRIWRHQSAKHAHMIKCPRQCLGLFHTREELEEHKEKVHGIVRRVHHDNGTTNLPKNSTIRENLNVLQDEQSEMLPDLCENIENEMDYEDSDPGGINCEIPVDFDEDSNLDVPDDDSNVDLSDGDSFDTETNVNESDNLTSFELVGDDSTLDLEDDNLAQADDEGDSTKSVDNSSFETDDNRCFKPANEASNFETSVDINLEPDDPIEEAIGDIINLVTFKDDNGDTEPGNSSHLSSVDDDIEMKDANINDISYDNDVELGPNLSIVDDDGNNDPNLEPAVENDYLKFEVADDTNLSGHHNISEGSLDIKFEGFEDNNLALVDNSNLASDEDNENNFVYLESDDDINSEANDENILCTAESSRDFEDRGYPNDAEEPENDI